MSSYDSTKDKIIDQLEVKHEGSSGGFDVRIVSYDGGEPKIQIQPFFIKDNQKSYVKFSRIKLSMWNSVHHAVKEMAEKLK